MKWEEAWKKVREESPSPVAIDAARSMSVIFRIWGVALILCAIAYALEL